MSLTRDMEQFAGRLAPYFKAVADSLATIRREIEAHADGKKLKGDEIVGWLGEVYGKLLLGGVLVPDTLEHDIEANGRRVSVKARKGSGNGWRQSSAIPKITGDGCPSHLMFVHLNQDYSVDRIWLYPWTDLVELGRFKPHNVRGNRRSWVFYVNPSADSEYLVYPDMESRGPKP